jgi:hypothetical protein
MLDNKIGQVNGHDVEIQNASVDGFWLPQDVRQRILQADTVYQTECYQDGRPCLEGQAGGITVRWPLLTMPTWHELRELLQANRSRVPRGKAFIERLQAALEVVSQHFTPLDDPLRERILQAVPCFTGFSPPMIATALQGLDLANLGQLPQAFSLDPSYQAIDSWQAMDDLPGRLRFYPRHPWQRLIGWVTGKRSQSIFQPARPTDCVVGYGAGNVPGTALLIAFMAQATVLAETDPPVIFIRNSRQEPIFSAYVLEALQEIDPDLFCNLAVLTWDYEDASLQDWLLQQAGLVIAAASDETIAQIRAGVERAKSKSNQASGKRFHAHGHKFSFAAIGKEVLQKDLLEPATGQPLIDIVALLASLDSVFWDQYGCLSARNHFVEQAGETGYSAAEYASRLAIQMRILAAYLPRGAAPLQRLHDSFDKFKQLETTGQVHVFSQYDDEFLVVCDHRPVGAESFYRSLNDCLGRVVIVRPVSSLMDIPENYLRLLPPANLQSLSVAVGHSGQGLTDAFLHFAHACGRRGVTAIRTVGRGAFPQLAYSWDGLIPLDLLCERKEGHFTTIEFEQPFDQILDTYLLFLNRSGSNV